MSYSIILAGIKADDKIKQLTDLKEPMSTLQLPGSVNKVKYCTWSTNLGENKGYDVWNLVTLSNEILEKIRIKKGTTDIEVEVKEVWKPATAAAKGGRNRRRTNKFRRNRRSSRKNYRS